MNNAHTHLATLERLGAAHFADRPLAHDHGAVTKTVRRHRIVRGGATAVTSVGLVGGVAFGAYSLSQEPLLPGSASGEPVASPTASDDAVASDAQTLTLDAGTAADDAVDALAAAWDLSTDEARTTLEAALPEVANGNLGGWLATGTWTSSNWDSAEQMADDMVAATISALETNGVEQERWLEVLTVASIVEAEARLPEDASKIATVIYNRIEADMPLQVDSTLQYVLGEGEALTADDLESMDSPYNTYQHTGLPPTPIGSPGAEAIAAAASPADGDWLFFVTVNLETGETKFANTYEEHLANVDLLHDWVDANED